MIVGYSRCSTQQQNLDIQNEQLKAAGCDKLFEEKASGTNDNRPVLAKMINFVKSGDVIAVCRMDRLARSTKHLLTVVEGLESKGVSLRILNINIDTKTATGKMLLTMLSAVATMEVELMKERQAEGIAKSKSEDEELKRKGLPPVHYKGRKGFSAEIQAQVLTHLRNKVSRPATASLMHMSIASVHRIAQKANSCAA